MKDTVYVGDGHFGVRNDSVDFLEYQLSFFEEVLFPYCTENKIKNIIMVGDLFDKRKQTNTHTAHQLRTRVIERAGELGFTLIILIGNHDIYYRDSLKISTPIEFFGRRYKHVHIITEPSTTKIGNLKFDFIPWICKDNVNDVLKFISSSTSDIAVGHFELTGFKFAKDGQVCDAGLSPSVLRQYKQVISGHFHGASEQGNIKYIGTPFQLTWSDYNDPKGFYVMDTIDGSMEFIKNPFELYHVVEYDDEVNKYTGLKIQDFEKYKNAVVKLIVKNRKSKAKFAKFRDMFYQIGVFDLNIVEQDMIQYESNQLLTIAEAEDTEKLISDSVANVQSPEIDQKLLGKMMKHIHDLALEKRSTL